MEWKWSKANEKSLAQFVSDRAVELLPKLSASPFDLVHTREGRLNLVRSIYNQLLNQGIQYAYEKYHPEEEIQRLRTPAEVLYAPGEGTCLDLALLFCGLCFGYELLPLLIVIEGHALAAVSLNHQRRDWNGFAGERNLFNSTELFRGDENLKELQKLIVDGAYVAVECTGFAQTRSFTDSMPEAVGRTSQGTLTFERAIAAGREQLANSGRGFQFAIDIAVAHYFWKIKPFPLSTTTPKLKSENSKMDITGLTKLKIIKRMVDRWEDLAIYLKIPPADKAEFTKGKEPLRTLEWLEQRTQRPSDFKKKLRQAFEELEWDDLIDELDDLKSLA